MSWDIVVQDLPDGVQHVDEIPDDFKPRPLGTRTDVIRRIQQAVPTADFSDPSWGILETPEFSVEFNIGSDEEVEGFALHVRGGDAAAGFVADLLERCGWRALDTSSSSGIFDPTAALESMRRWRSYRDNVLMTNSVSGNTMSPDQKVANAGLMRPPLIYLAAILLGLLGHVLWRDRFVSRVIGLPAGALLVVASVALFVSARRAFNAAGTPVPGNQPATAIVGSGPYRFTRNPIYLAFSLVQLGLALLVNSLTMVLTLVLSVGVMALVVIPREERYLAERFPAAYSAYKASTRRWW